MAGPIFCDVFFSERFLLSYVDLKVVMSPSSNEFCLMSSVANANFKVKLIEANLKVRKVKVNPSVSLAHEAELKKGSAIYPIRRVECKNFVIPGGNPSVKKESVFGGYVPKSFVFGLVESAAFNGDFTKNPFNFKHFNMSSLTLTVNDEAIPFKPIKLSFITQFSGTGKCTTTHAGNDISRDERQ